MKLLRLVFILFLAACGPKDKYQEIPYSPEKAVNTLETDQSWSKYSPQIDIMVAFLWPTEIKAADRPKLSEIIQTSRDLKTQKESYLLKKRVIQKEFDHYECNCVINFECTGDEGELNENKCYEIEETIYENDRELISIFGLVEKIKFNVISIGGDWFKTHLDFRELPNSTMDFNTLQIQFSALDAHGATPYSYVINNASIIQEPYFKKLSFSFKRESHESTHYGEWEVDAAIVPSEASLLFQGKLFWNYQGKKREGLIYWEHPRIDW